MTRTELAAELRKAAVKELQDGGCKNVGYVVVISQRAAAQAMGHKDAPSFARKYMNRPDVFRIGNQYSIGDLADVLWKEFRPGA